MKKIILLFFLLSLGQLVWSLWGGFQRGFYLPDFNLYWQAGEVLRQGGNPYNLTYPLGYPAPALMLFWFLPVLSLPVASFIWTIFSLVCLLLSVILLVKDWQTRLVVLGLAFLSFPVKFTLGMGQINLLILLLIVLVMKFYQEKKYWLAGLTLALSLSLKMVPALFILYFLVKREWRVLKWVGVFGGLFWVVSGMFLGPKLVEQFITQVAPGLLSSGLGNTFYYNQSLAGTIGRLGLDKFFYYGLGSLIVIITMIKARGLASVLAANVLLSPISWQHHLVWLLPCLVIIKDKKRWLVLAVYLLIAFNFKNPQVLMGSFVGSLVLSHGTLGALLVWLALL